MKMSVVISKNSEIPAGFRHLSEEEIVRDYLKFDMDENCIVSKNEWMLTLIECLAKDIKSLEKEGPDSIMRKIQEFSDEFDKYNTDGSKQLEYQEYKKILLNNILISE